MPEHASGREGRFRRFWTRHRTLFWILHSLWAFTTGTTALLLGRERYGFVGWVVLFLVVTWATTLYFSRRVKTSDAGAASGEGRAAPGDGAPSFSHEATSYLTRSLYKDTLFFLLPFYWYSTVIGSSNTLFLILLAGLAGLCCLDLLFDRWLRTRPLFGMIFFATVAFSAINLLLPILLSVGPRLATPIAAATAVASAAPLALHEAYVTRAKKLKVGLAALVLFGLPVGAPRLVPAVPLRSKDAVFSSEFDRDALVPLDTLGSRASSDQIHGSMFILVEVFAPSNVPAAVNLEWEKDGVPFRTSRKVQITAHELGFRVWDGWAPEEGVVPPGRYDVVLRTAGGRVFGKAGIVVTEGGT